MSPVLLSKDHVWLLPNYYSPIWWQIDHTSLSMLPGDQACTNNEMEDILSNMYLLVLDSLYYNVIKSGVVTSQEGTYSLVRDELLIDYS